MITKIDTVSTAVTLASKPANDVMPRWKAVGGWRSCSPPATRSEPRLHAGGDDDAARRGRCARSCPCTRSSRESPPATRASGAMSLLDRVGLAGQRRLVDGQLVDGEQPQIGRDDVADLQQADVSPHQLRCSQLRRPGRAQDRRPPTSPFPQRRERLLAPVLVEEAEPDGERDDPEDDPSGGLLAEADRDRGRNEEQSEQRASELRHRAPCATSAQPSRMRSARRARACEPLRRHRARRGSSPGRQ